VHHVYDAAGRAVDLPPEGLVISTMLAELLDVVPGDTVTVEVQEGRRPVLEVPVAATFETYIGSPAYMEIGALQPPDAGAAERHERAPAHRSSAACAALP